jgi:hypothetical protein
MRFDLSVHTNFKEVVRNLDDFAKKQIPFIRAKGLNTIGKAVKESEQANIRKVFPTATPFTVNSVAIIPALKSRPEVVIYVRDIAARYLDPYERHGLRVLNSRALLNPKNINLNQFGNLPKGKLAALKARGDIFIGPVRRKGGETINGVWQRIPATKGTKSKAAKAAHLKLLIRFGDALPVKQELNYGSTAAKTVAGVSDPAFNAALQFALATAKAT